ncbi:MAG: phosphoribosylamine--glycine ligase [Candidatus Magasanikbacteria bacterium CG_4_10_14_0_2_um_filter_37_12]|uniref:Phosphoribosylamine--glycine ligase n=1 Tax=Candidatus Magasanikbacteria bacterium CG_4_10_14_0_2_um_filter_37_12 TaxID=1974637 RepID=A0A2M7V927_9BACT|nr:MAG: phosphoribosylamine--glycine ligase [Candidatus Magasanikbacteria bacterium CG_4_10_14_0_2_um_filter_37_12]
MNILLIGSGAREHAIARAIRRSPQETNIFCFGSSRNPGIFELVHEYNFGSITDIRAITNFARKKNIDFAIVGPEAPLEVGIVDELKKINIPAVGPTKQLAQLETSKSFTRNLLKEFYIPGEPKFKYFNNLKGVREFLTELNQLYVIKADGLMGGKGVKVSGDHLHSYEEAFEYCQELINIGCSFVIEEKFVGQEFSLMSFCDGENLAHMPAVQDHKRTFVDDQGSNTGGMGSYSDNNHKLPFLTDEDIKQAHEINTSTARALYGKFSEGFKGILYGGFMITKNGVKLIEYNARFGDPECENILPILKTDFVTICQAIISGNLDKINVEFINKATVCKYAVPNGYPDNPVKNQKIDTSAVHDKNCLYYASVDAREDGLYETGSRTIAVVGIGDNLEEAERIAEEEICRIKGPLFHRKDIGTEKLIRKKIEMVNNL